MSLAVIGRDNDRNMDHAKINWFYWVLRVLIAMSCYKVNEFGYRSKPPKWKYISF